MTHPRIDERDREVIAGRVQAGETLQSIAEDYDFTREWIRQIALSAGVVASEVRADRKTGFLAGEADDLAATVLQACVHAGGVRGVHRTVPP